MKNYEKSFWADEAIVTDNQIRESNLAEALVQAENIFYQNRKELIKLRLKEAGLNQNDLAKLLGHRKGYMSELLNGLRPFSREDLVIISRLFRIKFDDLIPAFIKQEKILHIRKTLESFSNHKIRLTINDFNSRIA